MRPKRPRHNIQRPGPLLLMVTHPEHLKAVSLACEEVQRLLPHLSDKAFDIEIANSARVRRIHDVDGKDRLQVFLELRVAREYVRKCVCVCVCVRATLLFDGDGVTVCVRARGTWCSRK